MFTLVYQELKLFGCLGEYILSSSGYAWPVSWKSPPCHWMLPGVKICNPHHLPTHTGHQCSRGTKHPFFLSFFAVFSITFFRAFFSCKLYLMSNFCPLVSPPLLYWCPGHLHICTGTDKKHMHTQHTHSQAESQFIHITTFSYFYLLNLQAECWVVYSLLPFFPFWQWPVPFFKMRNNTIRHQSVFCTCLLVHITIHLGEAPLFGDMDLIAKGTIYNLIMTKNDVIEKPSEDFIFKLHHSNLKFN